MKEDEAEEGNWAAPGRGRWNREVAHLPNGQTPLYRGVYQAESAAGLREANERYGVPASTLQTAHVNQRLYARVVPLLEPPALLSGSTPPRPAVWLLPRLVPRFRVRTAAAAMGCGITGEHALNLVRGASPASAEGTRGLEPLAQALTSAGVEPKS